MNYLNKHKGINDQGMKRIATTLKVAKGQEQADKRDELMNFIQNYYEPEEFIQQLFSLIPDEELIPILEKMIEFNELGYEMSENMDPDGGFAWGEPIEGHPLR